MFDRKKMPMHPFQPSLREPGKRFCLRNAFAQRCVVNAIAGVIAEIALPAHASSTSHASFGTPIVSDNVWIIV